MSGADGIEGALVEVDESVERDDDVHLPAIAREDIDAARGYADASRARHPPDVRE